ncbi:Slp family lipoprotein [Halorhodospira neutriphila]|uniref:Outer-membrane lipoprotein LolB n=1 Tax=Halorhodospira neutriphila TaxID=168379 RepID=A0ABS1E3Z5_9GAMM|nr:Slp family lipoprotein [Halorhodospira neutriphila]MBK1726465.1 hypothetical protein [Halorhodospira neutriphila]
MTRRSAVTGLALLLAAALLAGCAAAPFERGAGVAALTAREAAAAGAERLGAEVIWGGRILEVEYLEERTRLEVVAYPLDRRQLPQIDEPPEGRFLIDYPGFLEGVDYRAGRLVTASGPIRALEQGQVGEQRLDYPVLATERVHLWPEGSPRSALRPRVHFGIGVIISR